MLLAPSRPARPAPAPVGATPDPPWAGPEPGPADPDLSGQGLLGQHPEPGPGLQPAATEPEIVTWYTRPRRRRRRRRLAITATLAAAAIICATAGPRFWSPTASPGEHTATSPPEPLRDGVHPKMLFAEAHARRHRRRRRIAMAAAPAIGAAAGWAAAGGPHSRLWPKTRHRPPPPRHNIPNWKISYTMHTAPAPISSSFIGALALSSRDAWAIGNITSVTGPAVRRPALRRWNGRWWAAVSLPKTYRHAYLYEIAGSSPANVWVFGQWQNSHGADSHVFALRWNGSWSRAGWWATSGDVSGAVVLGPRNVWIFGGAGTWHYDGKGWRSFLLPYTLNRASAVTGNDIWAVSTTSGKPVLARWHDRHWSSQRLPANILADQVTLTDVAATPAGDIWVVGGWFSSSAGQFVPMALEWAGGRWQQVPIPGGIEPDRVIYDGLGGLWLSYFEPQYAVTEILHYTAGTWRAVGLPQVSGKQTLPIPLARVPGSPAIFAAGGLWVLGGFPYSVGAILEYGR